MYVICVCYTTSILNDNNNNEVIKRFDRYLKWYLWPLNPTDNTCVNVISFSDHLYALTDASVINAVSTDTLDVVEKVNTHKLIDYLFT